MAEPTQFPSQVAGPMRFDVDDMPCIVDAWGRWNCDHPHTMAPRQVQDTYEDMVGWTVQSG